MMSTTLELLIAIVEQLAIQLLPKLGVNADTTALVDTIITTLEKILPDLISAGSQIVDRVSNIIAALKSTNGITQDQWNALDAQEKQIDADFDQAASDEGL